MFLSSLIFVHYVGYVTYVIPHEIYEGQIRDDWSCGVAFEGYGNNCDQRMEAVSNSDALRCYSAKLDNKGSVEGGFFPSGNRALELYHEDDASYEYHIIIGSTFHCQSHCTFGVRLNNYESGLNLNRDVANNIYNMISYIDRLFYTIYHVNSTHITTSIYEGGTPNVNTWDIDNSVSYFGSGTVEIDLSDSKAIQRLKFGYISLYNGDTYDGRVAPDDDAWIEVNYLATDAHIIDLQAKDVSNVNDWMQYVDQSAINWQFPVSYDGFDDVVSGYKNSNWGYFPFLDLRNVNTLIDGQINKHDIIGFSIDTKVIVGNPNYNGFGFSGGYRHGGNRGWQNCWQTTKVFLYPSLMDTTEYSKVSFTLQYAIGLPGSVQAYLRNFHWVYQDIDHPNPTENQENCEDSGKIKHVHWSDLMNNGGTEKPEFAYYVDVSSSDLTLSIDLELEYLGYSYGIDDIYGYGTTYHLGFYLFDGLNGNRIYQPANCDNRLSTSFENRAWTDYWRYSGYPNASNQIGTDEYLAYPPPSGSWEISMDPVDACSKLKYSAVFGWDQLKNCKSFDESRSLIDVDIDNQYINMSGIFFINVVSPFVNGVDINKYYVYELLSYPFIISVSKTIYVLDSVGINLFQLSIMTVGKNNDEEIFNMVVLTESAEYMSLSNPVLLSSPHNKQNYFSLLNTNSNCTSINRFICSQFWELEAVNLPCPFIFTGQYALQFDASCNQQNNVQCNDYITTYGSTVSLSVGLTFDDEICKDIIWSIQYDAEMIFYSENAFITPITNNHQFIVGEDRVFTEIAIEDINVDGIGYSIIDTELMNVWLCTIDEVLYGELSLDASGITNSGCFSSNIDDDGPYHIIVNHNDSFAYNAQYESDSANNMVRFSFIVPNTISRNKLYIEAQLNLGFTDDGLKRRRLVRLLSTSPHANQISFSMDSVVVVEDKENNLGEYNQGSMYIYIIIIISGALIFMGIIIALMAYYIWKKNTNPKDTKFNHIRNHSELTETRIDTGLKVQNTDETKNIDEENTFVQ